MTVVHVPAALAPFTEGRRAVELPGHPATVGDAFQALFARHPNARLRVVDEQGQVRPHVNVFVASDNIRDAAGLSTPIGTGDEIHIIAAVSGGLNGAQSAEPGYGSLNTTMVGEPGYLSTQKFDGLPEAAAMYCVPPTA